MLNLIKKYPDKCSGKSKMQTPFDNANLETLEFLLQLKKEENIHINQISDQDGNSLMHKAIIYNQQEVVRYLLVNYPSLVGLKNSYGIYPIHLCVMRGNMEMLRLISRESKKLINKRDLNGFTPAMHAAIEGKFEALKYLLDNASAKNNKLTKNTRLDKYTLLHLAVVSGSLETVQYLLLKMGLSYLKYRTKDGATVFHLAAARGHDEILEYLLAIKSSKIVRHEKDITGSSAAHDAAENGHYKCLKILNDAGLDMYSEDIEHITPYDLAMASKNTECRKFANSLKKTLSLDDGPIQINNNSLLTIDLTSTSIIIPQNGGSKKVNLKRISSMLRLRRAKDLNHEPAYLYTQRFRPAPVSLPQSSQIAGFQNGTQTVQENEDDLNDSAIDELINHVHNNSNKKYNKLSVRSVSPNSSTRASTVEKGSIKSLSKDRSLKGPSPSITAAIIKRVSRYQQHCQQLDKSDYAEPKKQSTSPQSINKNSDASNLGEALKKSLSSSRESTPTIAKLGTGTPTPLLQTVGIEEESNITKLQKNYENPQKLNEPVLNGSLNKPKTKKESLKEKLSNKVTLVDSENKKNSFIIPPPPPMPPPTQHTTTPITTLQSNRIIYKEESIDTSEYCTIADTKDKDSAISPSSYKSIQRKSVAFQDGPPSLIIENGGKEGDGGIESRKLSLGRFSSQSELTVENSKVRRKSLTSYISEKALLVAKNSKNFDSKSTNQLDTVTDKQQSSYNRLNRTEFYEPEPDYWDTPDVSEATDKPTAPLFETSQNSPLLNDKKDLKKAVSLAEIIVQSISANNSNKSSLSSSSSRLHKQKSEPLEKIIMPMIQSTSNTLENNTKTKSSSFYNSASELDKAKLVHDQKNESGHFSDSSLNIYNSLDGDKELSEKTNKSNFVQSYQINTSTSAIYSTETDYNVNLTNITEMTSSSSPPPPPPPPPLPISGFRTTEQTSTSSSLTNSSTSSPCHKLVPAISLDSETLVQARQKLKIQSSNSNSSQSDNSDKENDRKPDGEKKKKNEFLLKEIQNHRLYNTKKDYVLDFLDRGSNGKSRLKDSSVRQMVSKKSTIIVVNNTTSNSNSFNRSLSNSNVKKLNELHEESCSIEPMEETLNNHHTTISPSFSSSSSAVSDKHQPNDDRFPYQRNQKKNIQTIHKYSSNGSNDSKSRIQSSSCNPHSRQYLKSNALVNEKFNSVYSKNSMSNKSASVDRINSIDTSSLVKSYVTKGSNISNKVLKISVDKGTSKGTIKERKMSSSISDLLNNYEQNVNKSSGGSVIRPFKPTPKVYSKNNFSSFGGPIYEASQVTLKNKNLNRLEEAEFKKKLSANSYSAKATNGSANVIKRVERDTLNNSKNSLNLSESVENLNKQRIRQIQPPQRCESELERVFKKRALQNQF